MNKYFLLFILLLFFSCYKDPVYYPPPNNGPGRGDGSEKVYKNVIFLIGDGMGLSQVSGASFTNENYLNIERCKYIGLIKTQSANNYITESAASATAYATGHKTNNWFISVDPHGNVLPTIVELLEDREISTGLITTSFIADATMAAFYAHNTDRTQYEELSLDLMSHGIDFVAGGGQKHFDQREDGLNLIDTMITNGYTVYYHTDSVIVDDGTQKVALFIAEVRPPYYSQGRGNYLPDATQKALDLLCKNEEGFFLMVEGAQIDWACAEWNQEDYLEEMYDFDRAIEIALDYADRDGQTLVVITGDHETGGLGMPAGSIHENTIETAFLTDEHTGCMVPIYAYGPGAEKFIGIYENTEVFFKFKEFFKLN